MENCNHHNTALYYIWENNCSSPSACFFDLQKGDICVLGRNDGYRIIYIDSPISSSSSWNDFHVIDSLTEYNMNLPKEHDILCMTGGDKVEGNMIVLRRLIDCCKNEWVKDFFEETKSVLSGIAEFWDLRQLIRLTGDNSLMYMPVAHFPQKEITAISSANSLYYIPEVDSVGKELVSKNVESGDFCICRKGNGLVFFEVNHTPVLTDIISSFPEIETVEETDIMFPLVFLQLCKTGLKKEKNAKFINRFRSAFSNRKSLEILDLALRIVQGENVSLPHVDCSSSIHIDVPEYDSFVVEKMGSDEQNTVSEESEEAEKSSLSFQELPEDVQLDIEIEFLKSVREQIDTRKEFKSKFSSAAVLYSFANKADEQKNNLTDSITSVYAELLHRIADTLEGSSCDKSIVKVFTEALEELKKVETEKREELQRLSPAFDNRKGKPWTEFEEKLISLYFNQGYGFDAIASAMGRTEISIKSRLASLGLIEYSYETDTYEPLEKEDSPVVTKDEPIDFYVENNGNFCSIFNKQGERVYSTTGKLKIFHGKVYRFNYKEMCFTVKDIKRTAYGWDKGTKKLVAYSDSDLYPLLDRYNFIDQIEDFIEVGQMQFNKMSVDGKWYSFDGNCVGVNTSAIKSIDTEKDRDVAPRLSANYIPKGKLKDIGEIVESSYDYLWLLAIIDFMGEKHHSSSLSYDELACMMIANAWELLAQNPSLRDKETTLVDCIEFLIEESKEYMDVELNWDSTKEDVYEAIKDYPMAGPFEDTVDEMLENAPYNILKAWIKEEDERDFVMFSIEYKNACLYALHPRKIDPYIEVNPGWKKSLFFDHVDLMQYFKDKYVDYHK